MIMRALSAESQAHSLADAAPGSQVLVAEILFDLVRTQCQRVGLHVGDILRCVRQDARSVRLRAQDGARVVVDRHLASFVAIELAAAPPRT
jgi:hypothetical protein